MGPMRVDVPRLLNGQPVRSTCWVFIYRGGVDPPGDSDQPELGNLTPAPFDYIAMQGEVGPQNQGFHWQGYIEFNEMISAIEIRDRMAQFGWDPNRLYLRKRWGTQQQAIDYVRKVETRADQDLYPNTEFREAGQRHQPNCTEAHAQVMEAIKNGATEKDIMQNFPDYYDKHTNAVVRRCQTFHRRLRWREVEVHVLYGTTGTGKTRTAIDIAMDETVSEEEPDGLVPYIKRLTKDGATQWDCYQGEEWVIMDEFMWQQYAIEHLLPDLDGNPLSRTMKYGTAHAKWKYVFITSNIPPSQWYTNADPEHRKAFLRRCPPSNWHEFKSLEDARRFKAWWPTRNKKLRTAEELFTRTPMKSENVPAVLDARAD